MTNVKGHPCNKCGMCCRSVSVAIDKPTTKEDWDELFWMLHHKDLYVYVDNENDWCVEFKTPCEHLNKDNTCKIYDERPKLCRDYDSDDCEVNGDGEFYKVYFKDAKELEAWLKKKGIDYKYKRMPK